MPTWNQVRPHPDVVVEPTDDGALVLHQTTLAYLEMNETAYFLWGCLLDGASEEEAVELLCRTYSIETFEAQEAVRSWVAASTGEGILIDGEPRSRRGRLLRWLGDRLP